MTIELKCRLYYSITGEQFAMENLSSDQIESTPVLLHIYTNEEGPSYELSVPDPIVKGQFFNSECYCAFINEKEELLTIGDENQFKILMMRDGYDLERLHIKFETQEFKGNIKWQGTNNMESRH